MDTYSNLTIIENIRRRFFSYRIVQTEYLQLNESEQRKILEETLLHPQVRKYPPKTSFCKRFLKSLLNCLEANNSHIIDEYYAIYGELLNKEENNLFSFKNYLISDSIITIKENNNLISDGTTGLHTWEAAFILAEWCLRNKTCVKGSNVLELGSGTGLAGIIIAKFCNIKSYCFTDCHPNVISLLRNNVEINFDEQERCEKHIEVEQLDWVDFTIDENKLTDLLIASDVVYDLIIFQPLCNVFKTVIAINSKVKIVLVNTLRNLDTYRNFIIHLDENNLKYKKLEMFESKYLEWDKNINCEIIEISY